MKISLMQRGGVRARSVVAATVVVAVAYTLGSALFIALLQQSLLSTIDGAASTRAVEVAGEVRHLGLEAVSDDLVVNTRSTQIVQVVDSIGRVVLTSSIAHRTRLSDQDAGDGAVIQSRRSRFQLFDLDDPYVFAIAGAIHDGQHFRIVVATSVEGQRDSLRSVLVYLALGLPIVLILVGAATWWLVGRALAPVDEIRVKVESIGANRLDQRVPVSSSGDEIARLAVTMNQLLTRLEVSQREQRQFVGDASHELRSPLATVIAALELASDDAGLSWEELQPLVETEARRMQRLVSDLLMLARADERGLHISIDDVDLDDIVSAEALRVRHAGAVAVVSDVTPVRVEGDLNALSQAVRNLVDNAARAARSRIELGLHQVGDTVTIRVDDDGAGIAPADRERVFGRFVRLDESRERAEGGSGLGLAIVERIVLAHGGRVLVADAPIGGARFEITLPVRQPAALDPSTPIELEGRGSQPPVGSKR